jgi:hypothetical protein
MFNPKECINPWTNLFISYNGCCSVCCFFDIKRETNDLAALWNSDGIKNMRKNIVNYDVVDSRCHHCFWHTQREQNTGVDYFETSKDNAALQKQKQNLDTIKKNVCEKRIHVDGYPAAVILCFGTECNISCIMCFQKELRGQHNKTLDTEMLFKQADFLSHAASINIIGGEPFVMESALEFLCFAGEHEELRNTMFTFITNGTVIDRHVDLLTKFKHIEITFSIDSFGEYYEKIRRGASWKKVKENVELIAGLAKRSGWKTPRIHCVLMKSGLPGLYDLCKWVVAGNMPLSFDRINDFLDNRTENIFDYSDELEDISGWQEIFKDCISFLYKNDYDEAGEQLFQYFALILQKQSRNFPRRFFMLVDIAGKDLREALHCHYYVEQWKSIPVSAGRADITAKKNRIELPLIPVPGLEDMGEFIFEITILFHGAEHNCSCICSLQNERYDVMENWMFYGGQGEFSTIRCIPAAPIKSIRLVLNPVSTGTYTLPERIIIKANFQPEKIVTRFKQAATINVFRRIQRKIRWLAMLFGRKG